jgi:16S rRNA (uracil1498-N3)-methyltransferase
MKPRRFFAEGDPLSPGERLVEGRSARYLSRVLRLGVGARVILFDGSGYEFPAEILEVGRQFVRLEVSAGEKVNRESSLRLWLALGLCQPAIMDLIVQKVTEIGVTEIIPVRTQRAQRWLAGNRGVSREKRWERIAQEAARQSGRNKVPQIWSVVDFSQLVRHGKPTGLKLIFWEEENSSNLKQTLAVKGQTRQVGVMIGPEGGFSAEEVQQAKAADFHSISLGRRILRAETAAIVVIGLLQYELGDLGLLP